jgi:hypothetical protein
MSRVIWTEAEIAQALRGDPMTAELEAMLGEAVANNKKLRAEVERLTAAQREAFRAGFWCWCGPANSVELELAIKEEQEGWEEWQAKPKP